MICTCTAVQHLACPARHWGQAPSQATIGQGRSRCRAWQGRARQGSGEGRAVAGQGKVRSRAGQAGAVAVAGPGRAEAGWGKARCRAGQGRTGQVRARCSVGQGVEQSKQATSIMQLTAQHALTLLQAPRRRLRSTLPQPATLPRGVTSPWQTICWMW